MANPAMESKARHIFREALALYYIEGLQVDPQVETWLKNHGGWLPDPQELYGDGTPLDQPADEGEDATSADPVRAMGDAKVLMPKLFINLIKEMDNDLYTPLIQKVSAWMKEGSALLVKLVGIEALKNEIAVLKVNVKEKDDVIRTMKQELQLTRTLKEEIQDLKDIIRRRDDALQQMTTQVIKHEARISVLQLNLETATQRGDNWKSTCNEIVANLTKHAADCKSNRDDIVANLTKNASV